MATDTTNAGTDTVDAGNRDAVNRDTTVGGDGNDTVEAAIPQERSQFAEPLDEEEDEEAEEAAPVAKDKSTTRTRR